MMVSFKTLLLPLAASVTLAQAGSHAHHKRYRYHQYHNGTEEMTTVVTSSPLGTGIKTTELPAILVEATLVPIFTSPPIQSDPVTTTCITKYETKAYTYTLGNGKAHTTAITHIKVITQTVTTVPEPTKVDSVGGNTPGANAEEDPDYTSTSTTTVFVTVTRTLPLPIVEQTQQTPCPVNTVYVTIPVGVSVSVIRETLVQTVKETVKETINLVSEPPAHTSPPAYPPYSNHTTTPTVHQVTLTVVPIPY
ncbi:hypothetical protein EV426DRAFT_177035 [Tirmania nivea]|nr:hypothetical protein EV426DRAFT_177035 [Tirmania nivea]